MHMWRSVLALALALPFANADPAGAQRCDVIVDTLEAINASRACGAGR